MPGNELIEASCFSDKVTISAPSFNGLAELFTDELIGLDKTMFFEGCPIILVTPATTGFSVSKTTGFFCIKGEVFFCRSKGGLFFVASRVTLVTVVRPADFTGLVLGLSTKILVGHTGLVFTLLL